MLNDGIKEDLERAQGSAERSSYFLQCWYKLVDLYVGFYFGVLFLVILGVLMVKFGFF